MFIPIVFLDQIFKMYALIKYNCNGILIIYSARLSPDNKGHTRKSTTSVKVKLKQAAIIMSNIQSQARTSLGQNQNNDLNIF